MTRWKAAYKERFVLTSAVILLPTIVNAWLLHQFDGWPLGMLATHWLLLFFILRDNKNSDQSPRVMHLIFWIMPVSALIYGAVRALVRCGFDTYALITTILYLAYGLLFLVLGNLMPKVRQNNTIGIKIKWALENEENWIATHRFSGRLWVIGGLVSMSCALFAESGIAFGIFFTDVFILALLPMVYSYRYYRRQLASGHLNPSPISRKSAVFVAIFVVAICAFTGWTLFSGSMNIDVDEDGLRIETAYWQDLTVPYSEIDSVTYYDHDPSANIDGTRTNGFGNLRFSMGKFENDLYGSYIRYTHTDCDACVVIETNSETIVLNDANENATRTIYEQLMENMK